MFKKLIWNVYALCYDVILFSRPHQRMFSAIIQDLVSQNRQNVADVGSGTGNLEVAGRKTRISFLCLDFSSTMLQILKAKKHLFRFKAHTMLYDINRKPSDTIVGTCDAAVLINVIFTANDLSKLLNDVNRLLKKDATISLVWPKPTFSILEIVKLHSREVVSSSIIGPIVLLCQFIIFVIPLMCLMGINVIVLLFFEKGSYKDYSLEEVRDQLGRLGFEAVKEESVLADQEHLLIAKRV